MQYLIHILALCIALLPHAVAAQSQRLSDIVDARMRHGWQTETGSHMAALHLRLAGNWMTYWRHPGESGIVPKLDWSGSHNLAAARIHWPEPRLHIKSGFASIGYGGEVVLPIELIPAEPGLPMQLDATLSVGICDDICIPVELPLQLGIHDTGIPDGLIATALTQRPRAAHSAGLREVSCELKPEKRGLRLSVHLSLPVQGAREFALVEIAGSPIRARVLPSERTGDLLVGHVLLRPQAGEMIDRSDVRISIVSENGALQHQGCAFPN